MQSMGQRLSGALHRGSAKVQDKSLMPVPDSLKAAFGLYGQSLEELLKDLRQADARGRARAILGIADLKEVPLPAFLEVAAASPAAVHELIREFAGLRASEQAVARGALETIGLEKLQPIRVRAGETAQS